MGADGKALGNVGGEPRVGIHPQGQSARDTMISKTGIFL